jgi:hypothetical protein
MNRRLRQRNRTKLKVSGKLLMAAGVFSIALTMFVSWLVYLNMTNLEKVKASGNSDTGGNRLNTTGEVISEFTWERDPVTKATLGPDASTAGKYVHSAPGGRASTNGLAPGKEGKNIDLVIPSSPVFDQDGIDISIDFRRNEESGSFVSRGNVFNFGMNKGFICIAFRTDSRSGGEEKINVVTGYEIPIDNIFRNYRFIYNPETGKAEIFVNSIIVWSYSCAPGTMMYWEDTGNLMVGKDMNGGGRDIPVFDNLVIRSAGSVLPLAESLISFRLEPLGEQVKMHWSTSLNDRVDEFLLQRSTNGIDFTTFSKVKANSEMNDEGEYSFVDKPELSTPAVLYYRIRQNFRNGKFSVHALSAIKLNVKETLSIEQVSPVPFKETFDISYFTPGKGRVSIELTNAKGEVKSSENFEAAHGKNIHVFKSHENLESGTYTLNLIFGDKKVSTRIIKS